MSLLKVHFIHNLSFKRFYIKRHMEKDIVISISNNKILVKNIH